MNQRERFKSYHVPCPCGKSSDAYCIRPDDSGYCFSCGKNFNPEGKTEGMEEVKEFVYQPYRGISRRTMEFSETKVALVNSEAVEVGFKFGNAIKIKGVKDKSYSIRGPFQEQGLFLQDKFDPGSYEAITIFEGEEDTLTGVDLLTWKKLSACVGLKSGAQSAATTLKRPDIYDFVNSFSKIYICFDNDRPGQDAVQALAGLFDFRKTYIVKLNKRKDANEYLQHSEGEDFINVWKSANRYAPDNLISSFSDIEKALEESRESLLSTYPFPELTKALYGIHEGEIVVVKAPEGVGKTEFFRAFEYHVLKETKHPIGIIHLEEDNGTTIKAIAGYELGVPAVLPDCGLSKEDILKAYRSALKDDAGRVHIHSSFSVEEEKAFYGTIRFLVAACGVKIIFLDHISWMGTGIEGDDDGAERKRLDRISQNLKLLAKELRCAIVMISHVNDDGKTRGSRNISKVANTVISLDRDLLSGSTVMTFLAEKARLGGRTGPAGAAEFHRDKGKLEAR
jgi:twinkle protein